MAAETTPLVSIVTPVYNGERHLAEAIESVLAQTYENWEYVVSDNRSTDRTREIVEKYARRDERVRLVSHDEHLGLLQSWNRTIRLISPDSKYAKVLHADDWLFPECLRRMVTMAEEHPSVGIVSAYRLDGRRVGLDGMPHTTQVVPGREFCRGRFLGEFPFVFGSPSSVMFRSDLVRKRDPFYDEENLHGDTGACYDVLLESDLGFVHQVLTFTRRHEEAFTTFTQRVGTYRPLHLEHVIKYGPIYLTQKEYERAVAVRVATYLRFLLYNAHRLGDEEFRDFHRAAIARLRKEIAGDTVARGLAQALGRKLNRLAGLRSRSEPPRV
jgi:glycosyltransferase involved in cell wall biosynthesis